MPKKNDAKEWRYIPVRVEVDVHEALKEMALSDSKYWHTYGHDERPSVTKAVRQLVHDGLTNQGWL